MDRIPLVLTACLAAPGLAPAEEPESPHRAELRRLGTEPHAEALADFLRAIHPGRGDIGKRFAALVRQLGDDAYPRREAAVRDILAAKVYYPDRLREAAQGDDPEVAARARMLLDRLPGPANRRYEDVLCVVFNAAARDRIPGLVPDILRALESSDDDRVLSAGLGAVRATARDADLPALRSALEGGAAPRRAAAVRGLGAALGAGAVPDLAPLLADRDARVRLQAALALADWGDRRSLAALVELLDAGPDVVRAHGARALASLTGQKIPYAPYAPAADRAAGRDAWRAWLDREGRTAALKFPIPDRAVEARPGLVLWNRLGSEEEIVESAVGPGGTWNRKGRFVPGVLGGAIELDVSQSMAVNFPSDILTTRAGCIEIWAQLLDMPEELHDGYNPALFTTSDCVLCIHFNANDGAGRGGLCAHGGHANSCGTGDFGSWTYRRVLGEARAKAWHHYALVWDVKGIPHVADGKHTVAVFLDGTLNSSAPPRAADPRGLTPGATLGLLMNMHLPGGRVRLDDVKVWDFPKTDFSDRTDSDGLDVFDARAVKPE